MSFEGYKNTPEVKYFPRAHSRDQRHVLKFSMQAPEANVLYSITVTTGKKKMIEPLHAKHFSVTENA